MTTNAPFFIRPAQNADMAFVADQWLASYRASEWAGAIPNNLYEAAYSETIRQLLARGATLLVACNPTRPSQLLGFVCYERSTREVVLHYCFVKEIYRKEGVGRALFTACGLTGQPFAFTFKTRVCQWVPLFKAGKFIPAIARRQQLEPKI